ncbi:MAG: SDR family oxidoreductase [Actinobacteria bacterium]|nr:SDR family oxidoreductase [Actinomycetota bacterium]
MTGEAFSIDPDLLGLVDEVALVLGGGGEGMGRSHCVQLARAGCDVVVADLDADGGCRTVAAVEALGRRAIFVETDATDSDSVRGAVAAALAEFDRLDVQMNHVGGTIGSVPFLDYDDEDWDRTVALNLKPVVYGSRHAALAMIERGTAGRIINTGSSSGITAADALSAYGAAKAGVIHLTKTLALELAQFGIRVNCIVPGTHEPMDFPGGELPPGVDSVEEFLDLNRSAPALGRLGRSDETAGLAVFFASRLSAYVTGQALLSDGGLLLTINRPRRDGRPEAVAKLRAVKP